MNDRSLASTLMCNLLRAAFRKRGDPSSLKPFSRALGSGFGDAVRVRFRGVKGGGEKRPG